MNTDEKHNSQIATYLAIGFFQMFLLTHLPAPEGYGSEIWVLNAIMAAMFVLLVFLTARLARMNHTSMGILLTAIFILLFNPSVEEIFSRDAVGIVSLGSQCIVPFFMGQYTRIRRKDFNRWYVLMLLMGIFCSYTHNGLAIPMCATFLWLSFRHFHGFFSRACWPMVVGFAIGTTMSILMHSDVVNIGEVLPNTIQEMPSTTRKVLNMLWETKVFVISVGVTGYLIYSARGRQMLRHIARRHYVLCCCLAASFISMPLAPLGIDNAVEGICFFCMFWLLFIARYYVERYWGRTF